MLTTLAKIDYTLRPIIIANFPELAVKLYSKGKRKFISEFVHSDIPKQDINFSPKELWGINFRLPLFNSAGMLKYGLGYYQMANLGAGAVLFGTTTSKPRNGNNKNGVLHPFIPLPKSGLAINWMGLPNKSHLETAKVIAQYDKIDGCPIGASASTDPLMEEKDALKGLVEGLFAYENASVDFIEINESCPNVEHTHGSKDESGLDSDLVRRLHFISENYLIKRKRNVAIIVKLSNETEQQLLEPMLNLLIELGFDGINIGNTITNYNEIMKSVNTNEKEAFRKFTSEYGGGVSGEYLKEMSYNNCRILSELLSKRELKKEFHIIRTGGVSIKEDLDKSMEVASLAQWYTGFFSGLSERGWGVYGKVLSN